VDLMILACSVPAEPSELHLAPAVAARVGVPGSCRSFGVTLGDASGLLAIAAAAEEVRAAAAGVAVAGGADAPSRVPYWVPGLRGAPREEAAEVVDPLAGAAIDPGSGAHGALASDGGDRAAQDAFALRSHERAREAGVVDADPPTVGDLAALKPVHSIDGTITTGNSPAPADGGAVAVVSATPDERAAIRLRGSAHVPGGSAGPESALAEAIAAAAGTLGISPAELGALEVHETSAALCLAAAAILGVDPERLNARGWAIASGAPGAASGPLLVERARDQLAAADDRAGAVVAMAVPGGGGLAVSLERT
jgi:acetyl-CoA C-acetyltransferase